MALIGMDVATAAAVSSRLRSRADQIADLTRQVDATVTHLSSTWKGHDATVFASQTWPSHQQRLRRAQTALTELSQVLHGNIEAQRVASRD